jgi:iron complex transport system substrate-binding protein
MFMKKAISVIISILLMLSLFTACSGAGSGSSLSDNESTREFTDSAGRTVELPREINEIAPSGAYAQMYLITLCPEKLMGLSQSLTRRQKKYLPEYLQDLPVFGQFYGQNSTMNFEEIIKADPDVIIDIGEKKANIEKDMDNIQDQTGIPVVFIESSLASADETYEKLGELVGDTQRSKQLADYCRSVLDMAAENKAKLTDDQIKTVYYGDGEHGTQAAADGSTHAEVFDIIGADNAVKLDSYSESGGDQVSMEQILNWNPDIVFLTEDANYEDIFDDSAWASVSAVENRRVYEIPGEPYNWLDRPPSVQRILGILWAGNLVYPDLYNYDMIEKTQEYYKLFYNYDLSEDEARGLLQNSTLSADESNEYSSAA